MTGNISLVLILHNRHDNLDRLISYYNDSNFPILIADSSTQKHVIKNKKENLLHYYTPGLTFTQKIEFALSKVDTPYVVMCADDDFIIPGALHQCVSFLEQNKEYSVAQGLAVKYYRYSLQEPEIRYARLYDFVRDIESNHPVTRLNKMFTEYRSVLYAVFRTEVLREAFAGAGDKIRNLFLNEYITAFLPILRGKYKELPILYQVREFAEDSDDKTAANLDTLITDPRYDSDVKSFLDFITGQIIRAANEKEEKANELLNSIVYSFSNRLANNRLTKTSIKKRIGKIIYLFPFFGKKLIAQNRQNESRNQMNSLLKNPQDKAELDRISKLLLGFNKQ